MNQKNFGELILRFKKEFPGSCVVIDNNGILLGIRVPVSLHEIPREFLEDAVSVGLKIFFNSWTSRPAPWRGLFLFELRIAKRLFILLHFSTLFLYFYNLAYSLLLSSRTFLNGSCISDDTTRVKPHIQFFLLNI